MKIVDAGKTNPSRASRGVAWSPRAHVRVGFHHWRDGTDCRRVAWGVSFALIGLFLVTAFVSTAMVHARLLSISFVLVLGIPLFFGILAIASTVYSRKFAFALVLNILFFATMKCLLVAISVIALVLSTLSDSSRHAARIVDPSELHGTWTPTKETLDFLFLSEHYYRTDEPHSIELNADGSVRFKSFAHGVNEREGRFGYLDREGSWRLIPAENNSRHSHQRLELILEGQRWTTTQSYYLAERDGTLFLWTSIGDPFAHDYLEHEKLSSNDH